MSYAIIITRDCHGELAHHDVDTGRDLTFRRKLYKGEKYVLEEVDGQDLVLESGLVATLPAGSWAFADLM